MKTKIILAFVVVVTSTSCAVKLTPDGGKEVSIDGVQAVQFLKEIRDAKSARSVQP